MSAGMKCKTRPIENDWACTQRRASSHTCVKHALGRADLMVSLWPMHLFCVSNVGRMLGFRTHAIVCRATRRSANAADTLRARGSAGRAEDALQAQGSAVRA